MLVLSYTGTVIVQAKSITHSWSGAVSITIQASTTPRPSCLHICFNVLILVSNLGSLNAQCFHCPFNVWIMFNVQCLLFKCSNVQSLFKHPWLPTLPVCAEYCLPPSFLIGGICFCFYCHPVSSTFVSYKIDQRPKLRWKTVKKI